MTNRPPGLSSSWMARSSRFGTLMCSEDVVQDHDVERARLHRELKHIASNNVDTLSARNSICGTP